MKLISEHLDALKERQLKFMEEHNVDDLKQVMQAYESLLNQQPENPEILFQYGTGHLQLGNYGVAAQVFQRSSAYMPDNPHLWSNLGCAFRSMHMIDRAKTCFRKAMMFEDRAETYSNMAACFVNEGNPKEGELYAIKAMQLNPEDARARWNYSLIQLELGNYKEGWKFYDAGLISGERQMRNYANPETAKWWNGEPGTLVLWDEQGLGDRILFANHLRHLKDRGDVILEVHPRLEGLYRRSFPWATIYPTQKDELISWPKDHKIDYKLPIASLSQRYEFVRSPYLIPNESLVRKYRCLIEGLGDGPYYGFSWYGGAPKTNNLYRSMKLADMADLFKRGGVWISLQYHDWAKEKIEKFRQETGLPVYHFDEAVLSHDYDEAVALARACDHVVTVCTSMVHVCGAAGIPCTVLVPDKKAWRYPDGDSFPWYGDHIKQLHKQPSETWKDTLSRVVL